MPSSTGTLVFNDQKIQAPDIYATESLGVGVSDPTSNLEVAGNAYVSSNLEVGTANLFVDTQTGRVGVGKTDPQVKLDVAGDTTITGDLTVNGGITKTQYRPGEIIEEISSICDGSQIEAISGTYTIENVTGVQNGSTTHTAVTGSTISYTPPTGTKRVYYRFSYQWDCTENSGISHHQMQVDGTTLTDSRHTIASNYASTNWHHAIFPVFIEYTINCDASSTDAAAGKFTSWTSPKTLRVTYREYDGSYESRLHLNEWWDGSGTDRFVRPHLTIRAIA
jgi:hypothetical protein